jgi:hypothetical protein
MATKTLIEMTRNEYNAWLADPARTLDDLIEAIQMFEEARQAAHAAENHLTTTYQLRGLTDGEMMEQAAHSKHAYEMKMRIVLAREAWDGIVLADSGLQIDALVEERINAEVKKAILNQARRFKP